MGYLLVNADLLREKGVQNFEKMPDGRGITDFSMLRVLGSIPDVEIVSTAEEMLAKIKEEEESGLYPMEEPLEGDTPPSSENTSTEGEQLEQPTEQPREAPKEIDTQSKKGGKK